MSDTSFNSSIEAVEVELPQAGKSERRFPPSWTSLVIWLRRPVESTIKELAVTSATFPKTTIAVVVLVSFGLLGSGLATNFQLEIDEHELWTPRGSYLRQHRAWIDEESGFPAATREFIMLFHKDGNTDLVNREQISRVFQALDEVRALPSYATACHHQDGGECQVIGITSFWDNNSTVFELASGTDKEFAERMSSASFPDGTPTVGGLLIGKPVYDDNHVLASAQSLSVSIHLPKDSMDDTSSADFEALAVTSILELDREWTLTSPFRVEVFADGSFSDEIQRSIRTDIPLVPIVFAIMGLFTSFVFWKRDRVGSRSLLGLMAVVSVLLSIAAGYGFVFLCGGPFTSMTQILPFVFFGVGLDDAFIISASYFRLGSNGDSVKRVAATMDDIGISIFLTTLTSTLAFGFGAASSTPAVFWLSLYAIPTMLLILLWQVSFFIACLVLDERRVEMNHSDCFRCVRIGNAGESATNQPSGLLTDKYMTSYAKLLLKPAMKPAVIVGFLVFTALCSLSTTNLKQAFAFTDVLPSDSYIIRFSDSQQEFSDSTPVFPYFYFRRVDQSRADIREQMDTFISDLSATRTFGGQPKRCWLRDFEGFVDQTSLVNETFSFQLDAFLRHEVYGTLYSHDIVFDAEGNITASRCRSVMGKLDFEDVKSLISALKSQENVSLRQPANNGQIELKFFSYDENYSIWQFFSQLPGEITLSTLTSICAVTAVAAFFIPHWSAAFFILPFVVVLYNDLLGVMQWAGIDINPVSYITLVMSIGLMVDYILHNLIRFYELPGSREEKVVEMLKTMGSSVMMGAITTFLGTLPLAFSSSKIFTTVFVSFIAVVTLGASHGLVLLPVVLSIWGPENVIAHPKRESAVAQ